MSAELRTFNFRGQRPAVFHARRAYFQMAPADRERLQGIVCDTQRTDGRSRCFALSRPLTIRGELFSGIRCKGISPAGEERGELPPHCGGGFDPAPIEVTGDGSAYISPPSRTPQGTNTEERTRREFDTALGLGPCLTDLPLGFGLYEGLTFEDRPVGFTIYAMRARQDLRLFRDLVHSYLIAGRAGGVSARITLQLVNRKLSAAFYHFGRVLSGMHRAGFAHRYPHLNNVGLGENGGGEVWVRDLDTSRELAQMSPRQKVGYLMIDLGEVMFSLFRVRKIAGETYSLADYAALFIRGYLGLTKEAKVDIEDFQSLKEPYLVLLGAYLAREGLSIDIPAWAKRHKARGIRLIYDHLMNMEAA